MIVLPLGNAGQVVVEDGKARAELPRAPIWEWWSEVHKLSRLSLAVQLLQIERMINANGGDNTTI